MSENDFSKFRIDVLKELEDTDKYKFFFVCVAAFQKHGKLNKFTNDLFPMMQACYQLKKSIVFTAERLNSLTQFIMTGGVLISEKERKA